MPAFRDYEGNEVRIGDTFRHFMGGKSVYRLDRYLSQSEVSGQKIKPGDAEFTIVEGVGHHVGSVRGWFVSDEKQALQVREDVLTRSYGAALSLKRAFLALCLALSGCGSCAESMTDRKLKPAPVNPGDRPKPPPKPVQADDR